MHHLIKLLYKPLYGDCSPSRYVLFTILPYGDYPPSRYMFLQTYYQSLAIENTIYVHTIYVSFTVCVSWIIKSSDVRFTNLKLWHVTLFICPRWLWLCVIQYFVLWLILRYCYTYNIYKNIPSRNHIIFNSLQIQDMSIFKTCQQLFKSVYSQQECFHMSYLYQCLDIRNILYECESAMLPPIFLKCQGSELWNIDDIFCLKYRLFLFISEYDMCLSIMYVL